MTSRAGGRAAGLAALLLVVGLAAAACGGDSVLGGVAADSTTSTTPDSTGPSDPGETTTTSSTTTAPAPAATTTSTPVTTTSVTAATSTTTTSTTLPLGPPPVPLQFLPDGLGITAFGDTPADAVFIVQSYLGAAPDSDSGWGPAWGAYGACPGSEYRQVEFGGLVLQFTDAGYFAPEGTRQFFSWAYDGSPPGIAFGPPEIGTTVADLRLLFPGLEIYGADPLFGDTFRSSGPGPHDQLWGTLTGTGDGDTVTFLSGGWGCGE